MKLIKKYLLGNIVQRNDGTLLNIPIVPNLPTDEDKSSKVTRESKLRKAKTDEQRKLEAYNRRQVSYVEPYNLEAHKGWMELDPITGEPTWHLPTTVSAEPLTEGQRMWRSPAFQLALAPMFDFPFMLTKATRAALTAAKTKRFYSAPSVSTEYFKYTDPDVANIYKRYMALRKISGLHPFSFEDTILPKYQRGLDLDTKKNLMYNTVERNIRELKKAGMSEDLIRAEREAAQDALNNVPIGYFTPEEYKAAGYEDSGGFFTDNGFISINNDPTFSIQFRKSIPRHEGRHLLQRHLTKPASYYKELPAAYGDDFEKLNEWEGASNGIKDTRDLKVERETTNRDARDYLFSFNGRDKSLLLADFDFLDMVIKYTPDDKIFEAVENANGYGKNYIKYLRENNLLTPEKAQAFREAMKHVGGYVLPIGFGTATYFNK